MDSDARARCLLVSHAPPSSFAPMTRTILGRLGYAILDADDFAAGRAGDEELRPDALIVDERHLAEVEDDDGPAVPIVLLTGRHGVTGADPRIVGALRRPAGMHDLFRILQQLLEDTPRSSPRVPTHLRTRCGRDGRDWHAALLSLSENGCLLRSPEPIPLGARLLLRFTLPGEGLLEVEGEVSYQLVPDVGIVFSGAPPNVRAAIASFVDQLLTDTAA
jgi:hypothetical protein